MNQSIETRGRRGLLSLLAIGIGITVLADPALARPFAITRADWDTAKSRLIVAGTGTAEAAVSVANAYDLSQILGTTTVAADTERWRLATARLSPVPCRVYAGQYGGATAEMDVANAPADCAPQPPPPPANLPPVSRPGGPYTGTTGIAVTFDGSTSSDPDGTIASYSWDFGDGSPLGSGKTTTHTYAAADTYTVSLMVTDDNGATNAAGTTATIAANQPPTAGDDTFALDTAVVDRDGEINVPVPGVLLHDTDPDGDLLSVELWGAPNNGAVSLNTDGSFTYKPTSNVPGGDSFIYRVTDGQGANEDFGTVHLVLETSLEVKGVGQQNQFNILMNYELGMHCTGFEFAYCCILPPYNSILAQVVKTDKGANGEDFPKLLEGDPNENKDAIGRETVLRDPSLDENGNFQKYVLRYWHEAQPRNDGRGKPQSSRLISAQELNSMFMWNTIYDVTARDADGSLITGEREGYYNAYIGDGTYDEGGYANGWLNHLYIYSDLEGTKPAVPGLDMDKIFLGVDIAVPTDCGPALHPLGPVTKDTTSMDPNATIPNDCNGLSKGNLLTFSGEHGTVVYTQMKVLEDLPITLTSPRIWEALGLPLTPLEDSLDFFADPGLVDEDSVRPFVAMKAQLHKYDPNAPQGVGNAVLDDGRPVIGFGTAPIDIPNCERCHSAFDTTNSPNTTGTWSATLVQEEIDYWLAYYGLDAAAGDSDWYPRLKGAAMSILSLHDAQMGTDFTACYPADQHPECAPIDAPFVQETRLGHESVICQKCHADNVVAAVTAASFDPAGSLTIRPISEAIHRKHRAISQGGHMVFADSLGRDGMCQGCHPAHRSDGDMEGYPITYGGDNAFAETDNRLGAGGCFVGRDVHSNPLKDIDGAETPVHLNVVGNWLKNNVARNQTDVTGSPPNVRGLWCTNCHTQLSQEIWKAEDCNDLVRNDCSVNPRAAGNLGQLANMIGSDKDTVISWLDPKDNINGFTPDGIDHTRDIWSPNYADALMAVIEVDPAGNPVDSGYDPDGKFSVNILSLCTTRDCIKSINQHQRDPSQWLYPENGTLDGVVGFVAPGVNKAVAVPFNAADDGRDHWLSAGEPHCADCHAPPYVEQSGNIDGFAPFNYPRKAGLMRYSRGHRDITCQGCHESTHGLYPVAPSRELGVGFPGVDATSYAQAANLNADGSHGPLKCGACHAVNESGVPSWFRTSGALGGYYSDFDGAVGWQHEFTENADPRQSMCLNCHDDYKNDVLPTNRQWQRHSERARSPRNVMDQTEELQNGHIAGFAETSPGVWEPDAATALAGVCTACHAGDVSFADEVSCDGDDWKNHLVLGRSNREVWAAVSQELTGSTCGW